MCFDLLRVATGREATFGIDNLGREKNKQTKKIVKGLGKIAYR